MTEETQKLTKLISVYGRVSTSNQENEGTIETQLSAVREFANKNNYAIVQEYLDNGWSGDSIVRPALDQLRIDAKKKIWEAVLVYDPDRLARRYSYQELIMDELREAGIEVIFTTIPAPKNHEDKILHGVRGLFAEYERAKISERFRLGKIRKVKEGHVLTTEAPYGYKYIPKKDGVHGYYEIYPEEAKIIKMIFSWIGNEGLNIRAVIRRLRDLGIRPRKSKRGVWATSTLTNMLRNKTYIGEAHWGATYAVIPEKPIKIEKYRKTKKTSKRTRPEEEWITSKIPVPAIVDRELFERTRARLKINSSLCPRSKRYEYLLGGKIYCTCGRRRHGEGPQHGKHLYYRCNDKINCFPLPPTCKERGINARIADGLVWQRISKLITSPDLITAHANRWINSQKSKTNSPIGDLGLMEREIKKLKEQEDRYNKAYGAGVYTIEQLKNYAIPIREQTASLETKIAKAKQEEIRSNILMPTKDEIESFAKETAETIYNLNFEMKRAIMMGVLDKVIGTQQELKVSGRVPIAPNHHVEQSSINRNYRIAKRGKIHFIQSINKCRR